MEFYNCRSYSRSPKNPALQQLQKSSKSASSTPQRPIWNSCATVGVRRTAVVLLISEFCPGGQRRRLTLN